jgi:sugar lactone lactonase YvrE
MLGGQPLRLGPDEKEEAPGPAQARTQIGRSGRYIAPMNATITRAGAVLAALAICSCSASRQGELPATGPAAAIQSAAGARKPAVEFRLKIPAGRRKHRDKYVSPATASIAVAVYDATHTHKLASLTQNTTPGAGGCSAVSGASFTCSFTLAAPPGSDTFDVTAYDGANGAGNALSAVSDSPYTVRAGLQNLIPLSLGGIPASVGVILLGDSVFATGNQAIGFQFGGSGTAANQQLQVVSQDADGYQIVNPGAPVLTLSGSDAGADVTIVPSKFYAGRFILTPLAQTTAPITLTATASYGTNQKVTATVPLQLDAITFVAALYSSYPAAVTAYAPWSGLPVLTIAQPASSNGLSITVDTSGNLYVAAALPGPSGTVTVYPPESTAATRTITGLNYPGYVTVDESSGTSSSGSIYVTEDCTDVREFGRNSGNTATRTLTSTTSPGAIAVPCGLAVDATGNLYVANSTGNVAIFPPGLSTTATTTLTSGISEANLVAFDPAGHLYVVNAGGLGIPATVTEYAAPFTSASAPVQTFGSGTLSAPDSLAVDGSGNVYVANNASVGVVEFGSNGAQEFSAGGASPAVAVDRAGNAFVAAGSVVNAYSKTGSLYQTLNGPNSLDASSIAVWP